MDIRLEHLPLPKYSQRKTTSRDQTWAPKEIKKTHKMDLLFDKRFLDEYFEFKSKSTKKKQNLDQIPSAPETPVY